MDSKGDGKDAASASGSGAVAMQDVSSDAEIARSMQMQLDSGEDEVLEFGSTAQPETKGSIVQHVSLS